MTRRFANLVQHGGHVAWGLFSWAWGNEFNAWWIGIGRFRAIMKSPRCAPLFSERYGHTTTLYLGRGWRITFRVVPKNL